MIGLGNVAELVNSDRRAGSWFVGGLNGNVNIRTHESSRYMLTVRWGVRGIYGVGWMGGGL